MTVCTANRNYLLLAGKCSNIASLFIFHHIFICSFCNICSLCTIWINPGNVSPWLYCFIAVFPWHHSLSRVTLYTAGHLHTAVPHCSHSRAPIVHTAVPRENNEHGCEYLRCTAVCKLPGCVEGHPWLYRPHTSNLLGRIQPLAEWYPHLYAYSAVLVWSFTEEVMATTSQLQGMCFTLN